MTSSSTQHGDRRPKVSGGPGLTLVVVDGGRPADLLRCVAQATAGAPRNLELVVASLRRALPPQLKSRRIHLLSAANPEALDIRIQQEALAPRHVLVVASSTRLSTGWYDEVLERASSCPAAVSLHEGADGGLVLTPAGVTDTHQEPVAWHGLQTLGGRAEAHSSGGLLVSAVILARNDALTIPTTIASIRPFVDEVVVCDTGSSDGTSGVAAAAGARVETLTWAEDFGRVHEAAMGTARTEWVLFVDADERASGDPGSFRAELARSSADQVPVTVVDLLWPDAADGIRDNRKRLVRRATTEWIGAFRSEPRARGARQAVVSRRPAAVVLRRCKLRTQEHHISKALRNARIARTELDQHHGAIARRSELMADLAKALNSCGKKNEGLQICEELRALERTHARSAGDRPSTSSLVAAGRTAVSILAEERRFEEASSWLDDMARWGEAPGHVVRTRVQHLLSVSQASAAWEIVEPFLQAEDGGSDPWGVVVPGSSLQALAAEVEVAKGDGAAAIARLSVLAGEAPWAVDIGQVLEAHWLTGGALKDFVANSDREFLRTSLASIATFPPAQALKWCEAYTGVHPDDLLAIATGNHFAGRLTWEKAMTWSLRAAERGLYGVCALADLSASPHALPIDRYIASVIRVDLFGDREAAERLLGLWHLLAQPERDHAHRVLGELGVTHDSEADVVGALS